MKSNLKTAHQNELAVLRLVHKYGHLRRQELARAMWPNSSEASALVMAHRTVERLLRQKHLSKAPNTLGGVSYLLTSLGANRLELTGEDAVKSGRGISSVSGPQFFHRTLGTRYLIEKAITGLEVYGEYAIYRGLYSIARDRFVKQFKKIPDGLILAQGADRGFDPEITAADWVEVESFYKPPRELRKILGLSGKKGIWIDPEKKLLLDRVVFVHSTVNSHEASLLKAIASYVLENKVTNPSVLSSIVIARCEVDLPFLWRGFTERTWLQIRASAAQRPEPSITTAGA